MSDESGEKALHDVKIFDSGKFLGYFSLSIDKGEALTSDSWKGHIQGSDYLVWGLNHRKVVLQFEDGTQIAVVVRSGGRIVPANSRRKS